MTSDAKKDRRIDTEKKLLITKEFLEEAIINRMLSGTWGKVSIDVVVEAGFIKEVHLDDCVVIRDLPKGKIREQRSANRAERLTEAVESV